MISMTSKTFLASASPSLPQSNSKSPNHIQYSRPATLKEPFFRLKSMQNHGTNVSSILKYSSGIHSHTQLDLSAADRLRRLVSEFRSLPEPLDRVKRLLHYGAVLPELADSGRVDRNRVTGCTTQVWMDVVMDDSGRMRFRACSDSEITKGFCSCLIWVLDGAAPEEVLAVRSEDMGAMNVGVVANSRVNTWQNVLLTMQKRTRALLVPTCQDRREEVGVSVNGSRAPLQI